MLASQILLFLLTLMVVGTICQTKTGVVLVIAQVFLLGFENSFVGDLSWAAFFAGKFTNDDITGCLIPACMWSASVGLSLSLMQNDNRLKRVN